MLQFFRKNQKIFFFIVTFFVVISFCFFGTFGTLSNQEKAADTALGEGVCGKPISQRQFRTLCQLIATSSLDRTVTEGMPNLFNPGVIEKDFLATGLAVMLVKPYFAEMKEDLDTRVKKINRSSLYTHPSSSQVGLKSLISIFSPQFVQRYELLKSRSDQATAETFVMMCQLYAEQLSLPPDATLKQFLLMQQNQAGLKADPTLRDRDLSLFGFKGMQDWFGPKFVPLMASFIMNAAQVAQEQGYQISNEEIRENLFQSVVESYKKLSRKKEISFEEIEQYYVAKIRSLGVDEDTLLSSWKKVLLFQKLFEERGHSVLIDSLAYKQFDAFAEESVQIDLYQLPKSLQFTDFLTLCKFQLYLETISQEGTLLRKTALMPKALASAAQVEERFSELVEQEVELEWRSVKKQELLSQVSLQETLSWQIAEGNWERLSKQFPELAKFDMDRVSALNALSSKNRLKVDQWARLQIVEKDKELLNKALVEKPFQTLAGGLRAGGTLWKTLGMQESAELLLLFKDASLKSESANKAAELLSHYTSDQGAVYEIHIFKRSAEKKVVPFALALSDGTLDHLLDRTLEKEMRSSKKSKEETAQLLFADYAKARLFAAVDAIREKLERSEETSLSLVGDLKLEKESKQVTRSTALPFAKEPLFELEESSWSSLIQDKMGFLGFYAIKGRGEEVHTPTEEQHQGHLILCQDAKRDLMADLLQRMHKEKAMNLLSLVGALDH